MQYLKSYVLKTKLLSNLILKIIINLMNRFFNLNLFRMAVTDSAKKKIAAYVGLYKLPAAGAILMISTGGVTVSGLCHFKNSNP